MTNIEPPSSKTLIKATLVSIVSVAIILVLVVLPAEYGVDPTGLGEATGLTDLNAEPTFTIEITDVIGGNEIIREVEIPGFGVPTPLPNPAVFQNQETPPETRTMEVMIPTERETEIKLVMQEGKAAVYSWSVDTGDVYVDFHGHDASFGPDFFVRYKEQQEGSNGSGSLTAPFSGEHGWYWLNYNEFDVVITLTVTGYFDDVIDYGLF
ncbi:MAG: hypothetical protein P8M72_06540 [Gammaproteobacteria bacterium]|nr:hypothetical protein [Gammaproteobacteria bacterium]